MSLYQLISLTSLKTQSFQNSQKSRTILSPSLRHLYSHLPIPSASSRPKCRSAGASVKMSPNPPIFQISRKTLNSPNFQKNQITLSPSLPLLHLPLLTLSVFNLLKCLSVGVSAKWPPLCPRKPLVSQLNRQSLPTLQKALPKHGYHGVNDKTKIQSLQKFLALQLLLPVTKSPSFHQLHQFPGASASLNLKHPLTVWDSQPSRGDSHQPSRLLLM